MRPGSAHIVGADSGAITADSEHSSPETLAQRLYTLHTEQTGFRHYAEPVSD
ncbi:hypothetical protein [Streptomyces sulphureus]|uniref:hypothetical protein n=1 Tax=Streptomyces sulphureus TaxID=47758 RepID=UPI0003645614